MPVVISMRAMRRPGIVIFVLTVAAAILRLLRVPATEPWLDEACSVWYASLPFTQLSSSLAAETHPPLYYLLLRWGIAVFGPSVEGIRVLSVVAGTAWVPLVWALGRRWVGSTGALGAAGILALHPLAIHYGVEARPYAVALLLVLAALERWAAFLTDRRTTAAGLAALCAVAAMMTHHLAAPVVVGVALVAWWADGGRRLRDLAWVVLPTLAGSIAFFAWVAGHLGGPSLDWIIRYWQGPGSALGATASTFAGTGPFPAWLGALAHARLPAPWPVVGVVLAVLLAVIGLADRLRARPAGFWPLAALLVVPIAFPLAVTMVLRPMYLAGRYEIFALPAFCLAIASGIVPVARRLRWPAAGVGLFWGLLVLATTGPWLATEFAQPHRQLHEVLRRDPAPVDAVFATGFAFAPFLFHERAAPSGVALSAVPSGLVAHPGWWDLGRPVADAELPSVPAGTGDVWLLSQKGDGFDLWRQAQAARIVASGRLPARTVRVADIELRVFSPDRPPGTSANP